MEFQKTVPLEADKKKIFYVDATCPLVIKVHKEAERHYKNGYTIILIDIKIIQKLLVQWVKSLKIK